VFASLGGKVKKWFTINEPVSSSSSSSGMRRRRRRKKKKKKKNKDDPAYSVI